jgi:glycosyltransferase involved in cell wall biosynthesis
VKPRISVVVPTYRRTEMLERCLAALAAQTLPSQDYEVIVVHDGPGLPASRVAARAAVDYPAPLRFFALPQRRGPAAARNFGWRRARGEIVGFTDDDTVPDPAWLANALAKLTPDVDAGWGRLVMPLGPAPTDYELDAAALATAPFVTANCFCRRDVLERLGGFDERFERAWREDSDLHFRLLESGARIAHFEDALVVHPIRPAPWGVSLLQQKKIQFDALLYKKHRALYRQHVRKHGRWDYYTTVAALGGCAAAALGGIPSVALLAGGVWAALTARFCTARLARSSKAPAHVAEMLTTSIAIPLAAVFWRARGAIRFRVLFL